MKSLAHSLFVLFLLGSSVARAAEFRIGPFVVDCAIGDDDIAREDRGRFETAERLCPKSVFEIVRGTHLRDRYVTFVERHDIPGGFGYSAYFCHEHRDSGLALTHDCAHLRTWR